MLDTYDLCLFLRRNRAPLKKKTQSSQVLEIWCCPSFTIIESSILYKMWQCLRTTSLIHGSWHTVILGRLNILIIHNIEEEYMGIHDVDYEIKSLMLVKSLVRYKCRIYKCSALCFLKENLICWANYASLLSLLYAATKVIMVITEIIKNLWENTKGMVWLE